MGGFVGVDAVGELAALTVGPDGGIRGLLGVVVGSLLGWGIRHGSCGRREREEGEWSWISCQCLTGRGAAWGCQRHDKRVRRGWVGKRPDEMRSWGSWRLVVLVPKFARLEAVWGRWGVASRAGGTGGTGCAFAGAAALAGRVRGGFGEEGGERAASRVAAGSGGVVRTGAGSRGEVAGC